MQPWAPGWAPRPGLMRDPGQAGAPCCCPQKPECPQAAPLRKAAGYGRPWVPGPSRRWCPGFAQPRASPVSLGLSQRPAPPSGRDQQALEVEMVRRGGAGPGCR